MGSTEIFLDGYGRVGRLVDRLKTDDNKPDTLYCQIVPFGEFRKVDVFDIPKNTYVTLSRDELGEWATFSKYHICPYVVAGRKSMFGEAIMKKLDIIVNHSNEVMKTMQLNQSADGMKAMEDAGDDDAYLKRQKKLLDGLQYNKQKEGERRD